MNFKKFLEEREYKVLTIPKGTKLYHGTIEQFKKEQLLPGNYDNVLWTTTSPKVARSYIPSSGSQLYTNTNLLARPSEDPTVQKLQKQIGIDYDYDKVEFSPNGRVRSYEEPPIFVEYDKKERELFKKMHQLKDKFDEYKKKDGDDDYIDSLSDEQVTEFYTEWRKIEDKINELQENLYSMNLDRYKNEYVNDKLKEMGYEPENMSNYDKNGQWELKVADGTIVPADYKAKGRLFTLIPKRDLKIYDLTMGETVEPDLLDRQYHELELFRKVEEKGFDGIKIADFLQHEHFGNVGHYSIGVFRDVIKDFEIEEIETTHPGEDEF